MTLQPAQPTVLIVDDEVLIRMMLADELEDVGCAYLEASDAAQALAVLEAHPEVSILFTDINMPGEMDGMELARRAQSLRPGIRLYLASGRERPAEGLMPADFVFIEKPYSACMVAQLICETA